MNPYGHPQPQPPPPKREFARIARAGLKRFGPLLLTGLAAVAEHHWLKRDSDSNDDPPEPPQRSPEQPDNSINEIRDEVKKLRKKLKLKKKRKYKDGSSSSSDTSSEVTIKGPYRESARDFNIESKSPTRDHRRLSSEAQEGMRDFNTETPICGHRRPLGEEQPQEWPQREEAYFHGFETWGPPPPPVPDPPQQYQRYETFQQSQLPQETVMTGQASSSRDVEQCRQPREFSHHRSRPRHRPRHHSLPTRSRATKGDEVFHAGKVAAIAGAIEALHVDHARGDWIGRKGVRVGTTMATSFGASITRDKDERDGRGIDAVMDVGKGLLVSRLVHGRVRRLDESEEARRRRRWSSSF